MRHRSASCHRRAIAACGVVFAAVALFLQAAAADLGAVAPVGGAGVGGGAGGGGGGVDAYAAVLERFVDADGRVDYAALARDRDALDDYTAGIAARPLEDHAAQPRDAQLAFWINAYNGLTLALVADHYPIARSDGRANSIRSIPGAWDEVEFTVMGRVYTLDDIEHRVIRATFGEPRVHVALVCAAVSCPTLRREPYRGVDLDAQLESQSRRFLARRDHVAIDRDAGVVALSPIFEWFGDDFVARYAPGASAREAVVRFVAAHVSDADRDYLAKGSYKIEYLPYDWTLNDRAARGKPGGAKNGSE